MKQQKNGAPPLGKPRPGLPTARQRQGAHVVQPAKPSAAQRTPPQAPAVYRPQPVPKVLQRKQAPAARGASAPPFAHRNPPAAPPVYKPAGAPKVLQTKSPTGSGRTPPAATVQRPAGHAGRASQAGRVSAAPANSTVQRRVAVPQRPAGAAAFGRLPNAPAVIQCYKIRKSKEEVEKYAIGLWGKKELDKTNMNITALMNSAYKIIAKEKELKGNPSNLKSALTKANFIDSDDVDVITKVFKEMISSAKSSTKTSSKDEEEEEVKTTVVSTLGIAPSVFIKLTTPESKEQEKYKSVGGYLKKKRENQLNKYKNLHLTTDTPGVTDLLEKTPKSGASSVSGRVIIDGKAKKWADDYTYKEFFKHPVSKHNHDIVPSEGDGEVNVLSGVLATCVNDFEERKKEADKLKLEEKKLAEEKQELTEDQDMEEKLKLEEIRKVEEKRKSVEVKRLKLTAVSHQVALAGPDGACDGCKDRIRLFKKRWREEADKNECKGSLVVTYFYRNRYKQRSNTTLYGWGEADGQQITHKDKFEFRTTGTKV